MKALGRPSRENVATSRSDEPTLLQALELTNGAYFNQVLEEGASLWLEESDYEYLSGNFWSRSAGDAGTFRSN